ncbi:MAG: NfeD family protein [Planctomycetota bacterium]|jgi:membrane-bound serine protease (ClpP class)
MGTILLIVLLIVAAMAIALLEILTPSFGLLGALALACVGVAIYAAWEMDPIFGIVLLVATFVLAPVYLVFLIRWLPTTALGHRVFLKRTVAGTGEGAPEADALDAMIGKTGTAETLLRPSGAVRVDGKRIVALSESGIIRKGQAVTVIKAGLTNVIVRAAENNDTAQA